MIRNINTIVNFVSDVFIAILYLGVLGICFIGALISNGICSLFMLIMMHAVQYYSLLYSVDEVKTEYWSNKFNQFIRK